MSAYYRLVLVSCLALCACGDEFAEAKASVRQQLNDPNSAEFRSIHRQGDVTCGEVNAKNKMGGYDGFKPFLISKHEGAIVRPDVELTPSARKTFGPELAGPAIDRYAFEQLFARVCGG